jgi:alpha-methylacyl-CoA racemase
MKGRMTALLRTRTRDEWCRIMETSDVCFAPVLSMEEAVRHPHDVEVERRTFIRANGMIQAGPAPGTAGPKPR